MLRSRPSLLALLPLALGLGWMTSEEGANPAAWEWDPQSGSAIETWARTSGTPAVRRASEPAWGPEEVGHGLLFNDDDDVLVVAEQVGELLDSMPRAALSVDAWVAIERPTRWGGLVSCVQDNGDYEKGFVLGYNGTHFTLGLATTGMDDGDGRMSYFAGRTPYQPGRWHHVAATFDGKTTKLYVDGELDFESTIQHGEVLYDAAAPLVLGAYRDSNENYPLDGRLGRVGMGARAWSAREVRGRFAAAQELVERPAWTDMEFEFLVDPYLMWPTTTAVSVGCETTFPSTAELWVRHESEAPEQARQMMHEEAQGLHIFRIEGLEAHQKYFYRVAASGVSEDDRVESEWLSFRTAAGEDHAYTFAVIGDTQTNGEVAKRVSDLAYEHRPNFVVHCGDLVDTGSNKRDWTDTFFPAMQPLLARAPLMPVLGNHEQDAKLYYDYMDLPQPERWYSFEYGNAEFFMIDGNRSLRDQSDQLAWLEQALRASTATWRFAVLHQPPYTSDSNDYGNTLVGASTRGDMNVRNIVALLEKYDVDVCFSGHVHDYERTFPIRDGEVTAYEEGGVIYVTAAGGGGSLEDFDPANTWFGHKKARRHHFVYVAIHGDQLEFQAVDEDGRLFDGMTLRKRAAK